MEETRGVFAGPVTVTVLIPAHNEAGCIEATLESLLSQSHPPEKIVVVADNCTDDTVSIARRVGVEVFESVDNPPRRPVRSTRRCRGCSRTREPTTW